MLSPDELADGIPFILKLRGAAGVPSQWVETLRGELARRWYDIYRNSDWTALRAQAADTFRHAVTEEAAERTRTKCQRCIVIRTDAVRTEDLSPASPRTP